MAAGEKAVGALLLWAWLFHLTFRTESFLWPCFLYPTSGALRKNQRETIQTNFWAPKGRWGMGCLRTRQHSKGGWTPVGARVGGICTVGCLGKAGQNREAPLCVCYNLLSFGKRVLESSL